MLVWQARDDFMDHSSMDFIHFVCRDECMEFVAVFFVVSGKTSSWTSLLFSTPKNFHLVRNLRCSTKVFANFWSDQLELIFFLGDFTTLTDLISGLASQGWLFYSSCLTWAKKIGLRPSIRCSRSSQSGINIRIVDFWGTNASEAPSKSPTKGLQVFLRVFICE